MIYLALRMALALLLAGILAASVREAARWRDPRIAGLLTSAQRRRRVIGALLLAALTGMCLGGTFLPKLSPSMSPHVLVGELAFWTVCLLTAFANLVVAYVEIKATRRGLQAEEREVVSILIEGAASEPVDKNDHS